MTSKASKLGFYQIHRPAFSQHSVNFQGVFFSVHFFAPFKKPFKLTKQTYTAKLDVQAYASIIWSYPSQDALELSRSKSKSFSIF